MKARLLIVLLACAKIGNAQTWVTIPDTAFVTYLHGIIPAAMQGDSLDITNTLVTSTTHSIIVQAKHIYNLDGVQYFTSLTCLDCIQNFLTSLPALPNTLQYLDCSINRLTSLPPLPNLIVLHCEINKITCFPPLPTTISHLIMGGNLENCLPNYLPNMDSTTMSLPLCAAGNSHGCPVAAAGIEQYSANNNINVYPNPNNGSFIIEPSNATKQNMQVYDVNGKLVLSQTINGKTNIDASILNEGVYNISLINTEGITNKKLVIVR